MMRRGSTLLELLIAVALLVTMAALAVPLLLGRMDEQAFESASDVVVGQLRLARAHARTTGESVVVWSADDGRLVEARRFRPDREARDARDGGDPDDLIPEPWSRRALPDGITVVERRPQPDEPGALPFEMPDRVDPARSDSPEPRRIVVYLPDGSALLGRPVWLTDDRRVGRIAVNPFTGIAAFERLADLDAEDQPLDEDDPETPSQSEPGPGPESSSGPPPPDEGGDR